MDFDQASYNRAIDDAIRLLSSDETMDVFGEEFTGEIVSNMLRELKVEVR